jgi:hypothetical protein
MLRSMWLFPLAAAVIAAVFAGLLARQFLARRKPYQLLWAIALLMYAGGSFALFLGVVDGWSAGEYRAFWLLGAVLNVPYLALGEVYLLVRNRAVGAALLLVLLFATAFAFNRVRTAGVDVTALGKDLPLGRDVFVRDPFALHLAQLYAYPTYAFLVLGTLWSAWKMRGAPQLRDRFLGTLGIAGGATIAAAGSAFAATGVLAGFSLTIAVAIAVMFWGFLRASRPPAPAPASPAPDA